MSENILHIRLKANNTAKVCYRIDDRQKSRNVNLIKSNYTSS